MVSSSDLKLHLGLSITLDHLRTSNIKIMEERFIMSVNTIRTVTDPQLR